MKKLILIGMLLAGACGPSQAGNVYTPGQQWPPSCGSSGLFLQATGNCSSTWASQSPPTSLLSSTNTWSASQSFNALTKFGFDGLEINTGGEFKSPGNAFDFLSNGNKFMLRSAIIGTCFSDHVANCTDLEIGRSADGFAGELQAFISSQYGSPFERLSIQTEKFILTPESYASETFGSVMTLIRNESSQDSANNNNVVLKVQGTNGQVADLFQVTNSTGTTLVRVTTNMGIVYAPQTIAQIGAITPQYIGETYTCSDCTVTVQCTAKTLTTGDFTSPASRIVPCS